MDHENETLRWPTNLDREAIVARLVAIRDTALAGGLSDLAAFFDGLEDMPSPRIGVSVISALTWLEGKPEYIDIGTQLSMVAMNLKNLR